MKLLHQQRAGSRGNPFGSANSKQQRLCFFCVRLLLHVSEGSPTVQRKILKKVCAAVTVMCKLW